MFEILVALVVAGSLIILLGYAWRTILSQKAVSSDIVVEYDTEHDGAVRIYHLSDDYYTNLLLLSVLALAISSGKFRKEDVVSGNGSVSFSANPGFPWHQLENSAVIELREAKEIPDQAKVVFLNRRFTGLQIRPEGTNGMKFYLGDSREDRQIKHALVHVSHEWRFTCTSVEDGAVYVQPMHQKSVAWKEFLDEVRSKVLTDTKEAWPKYIGFHTSLSV